MYVNAEAKCAFMGVDSLLAGRILKFMKKAIATLLLASACFAQGSHNPASMAQRRVDHLTKALSLTAAQQQQALTIFTNAATSEATIHASLKTERQSLAASVQGNQTANIQSLANQIGNSTGQLVLSEASANAAFFQLLTPAQQAQFTALRGHAGGPGARFRERRQ
jgi:Spy/CpxP family protein refolding chaperone